MQRREHQLFGSFTDSRTLPSLQPSLPRPLPPAQLFALPMDAQEIYFRIRQPGLGFGPPGIIERRENPVAASLLSPPYPCPPVPPASLDPRTMYMGPAYACCGLTQYYLPQQMPVTQLAMGLPGLPLGQESGKCLALDPRKVSAGRLPSSGSISEALGKLPGQSNPQREEETAFKDEVLPIINESPQKVEPCKVLSPYTSSRYRYLYKCIVRNLHSFIRKNREDIVETLKKAGFGASEIEHAFFMVGCHSDEVSRRSCDKTSLAIVNRILSTKSIYTYILRETLHGMLLNWNTGDMGRISKKNIDMYAESCKVIYEEVCRALGQPAQGRVFLL